MENQENRRFGTIAGHVASGKAPYSPISGAKITVYAHDQSRKKSHETDKLCHEFTDSDGKFEIRDVPVGKYEVHCEAFEHHIEPKNVEVVGGCAAEVCFQPHLELRINILANADPCEDPKPCGRGVVGKPMLIRAETNFDNGISEFELHSPEGSITHTSPDFDLMPHFRGHINLRLKALGKKGLGGPVAEMMVTQEIPVSDGPTQMVGGKIGVTLNRTVSEPTPDEALWVAIRNRTRAISFNAYRDFINHLLCGSRENINSNDVRLNHELEKLGDHVHGVGAYQVLKTATEVFLLLECGVRIDQSRGSHLFSSEEESSRLGNHIRFDEFNQKLAQYLGSPPQLPYITRVIQTAFPDLVPGRIFCDRVLTSTEPCMLELIWSYWHEEGMLSQSINAVSRRFQNVRGPGERDPLAHLEIAPLRPLNNLMWGHIQDEPNRLTVRRRAYEYDHHYGLTLYGKAVPSFRTADSRSKFLEGFHNLLHMASVFYKEDHDTTVIADGYPLLNALKEVHLLLAQGAHNQFGDLPWTARAEMLIQQWLMARPEMRDFLQSRAMVPYKEGWMPQVDTMKTMQGWSDTTVTHFRDLGVYGEQLLLSVRYGDWIDVNNEDSAKNWARYFRPEIQGYLHSYRAVTSIDLGNADTVDSTMPGVHLQKRLSSQQQRAR